ncbi:MAG: DNA-directed RNA polymerase subunit alpha [Rhabdochlamydiaceae bacterium]|nr:DNA-directed RNA polymerase subunit alpha [Rhabdochlamydiaceae bacterium]
MAVKYGKFELPSKIKIDEASRKLNFTRFIAEAFERGFGHTVGNALRRIMLSSLEAPAIVSVRIEGVPHEYMAIDGIIEDMTHIVLNLKNALLRKLPTDDEIGSREAKLVSRVLEITQDMLDKNQGHYVVTLKDLVGSSDFDVVNPDLAIFTVTKPTTRKVDLKVAIGRGYVPSERHAYDKVVDEIIIDSAFSPVRLVNYFVENTRVGQDTDFDRLILEVTTDGRISPEEALTFATQIGIHHFEVFDQLKLMSLSFDQGEIEMNTDRDALMAKLALKINEIELSVRSTNCLAGANIDTIAELVVMPESEMLKFRNFGKKSLNEIKSKLEEMGLSLGMDLAKFGINRDNVKQVIHDYLMEKAGNQV